MIIEIGHYALVPALVTSIILSHRTGDRRAQARPGDDGCGEQADWQQADSG
ncbi:hypothetical protein ACCS70_24370 [Rhizobium ruizarguesonis]|jgi:hypothetical protein|uniref:hypothetical protein n=1 Tax=Rhizobium ruizarguesonis TaxID=2081791 RepID=UPI000AE1464B|nr:hypothetical protein [Rhizobium ruizarguesonis]UED31567.1 hypothetical protein BSO17_00610 [Rhizobium ruizarguesonis]